MNVHKGIKEYIGNETDFLKKRTKAIFCYKTFTKKLAKLCQKRKRQNIYNIDYDIEETLSYLEKIIF